MTNPITTPPRPTRPKVFQSTSDYGKVLDVEAYMDALEDEIASLRSARPQSGLSAGDREKLEKAAADVAELYGGLGIARKIREVLSSAPTEREEDRELRALAELAGGDEWVSKPCFAGSGCWCVVVDTVPSTERGIISSGAVSKKHGDFIAKANPHRIISLLDRIAGRK
jgi:hypothetical protein